VDWGKLVSSVEKAARDLRLSFPDDHLKRAVNQMDAAHPLFEQLAQLVAETDALAKVLNTQAERSEMLGLYHNHAALLTMQLTDWLDAARGEGDAEQVLWVEVFGHTLQLHKTPLSVAQVFTRQREEGPPRAWIFTSATLAVREDFHYFVSQLGLESARSQSWPSPFDYGRQGLLYVPENMPLPHVSGFSDAVADAVLPLIEAAGGRTFVLCTTLTAVDRVAARLRGVFSERGWTFPLFVQGESTRTDLLERFRNAGNGVLVGSQSFWEGVDVRGEALSLVVVDKLPFAPPDDPVLAARITALEKNGKNGFMDCQLPEAIMSLKQGSGRLIRDEMDRGVLMICDTRLITKSYGRRIWQSLPPFSRTRNLAAARAFFSGANEEEKESRTV
jgi:ATP-dependent DNA helicase DinG